MNNKLIRNCLTIEIITLLIGTCIIPSATSEQTNGKRLTNNTNIITVDNEPGDADFTSIKEAVNYSSPGDTIEVYSGTYFEDEILITKENVILLGISHELGVGNDSGKPFIKGNGGETAIRVEASHIIVSNFTIENQHAENHSIFVCGIYVAKYNGPTYEDDVTISNCIIRNSHVGIFVTRVENIRIIDNNISNCTHSGVSNDYGGLQIMYFTATGNVITDCRDKGIYFASLGGNSNISGNRIRNCKFGIELVANNMTIYGNDNENCSAGIRCGGSGNIFTKNNFKNYSRIGFWFDRYVFWPKKNRWIGNYWDTWSGIGPKIILGFYVFEWNSELFWLQILFPGLEYDWRPAKVPYNIP
jgi:parallel beta-helix repeat protein